MDLNVEEGALRHGHPYLALGSGPPLVLLRGLTVTHTNPTGFQRRVEIRSLTPLARHYRVYAVNRAPGLAFGTTMADIATAHAEAIADRFDTPVDVVGLSSGGSVALQLAADHPGVVRRLVVAASAHRLAPRARQAQCAYADAAAARRHGLHHLAPLVVGSPAAARLVAPLMWLLDPLTRPRDGSDLRAFVHAEAAFDLTGRLSDITAPTLVVAGDRDRVYTLEIFRGTAEGVRDGRLLVYSRTSHAGTFTHRDFAADVTAFLSE